MKRFEPRAWELTSRTAFDQVLTKIQKRFAVRHQFNKVKKVVVLDNFDWTLFHSGQYLINSSPKEFCLQTPEGEFSLKTNKKPPLFWSDFEVGEGSNRIKKLSPLRALQPIATVRFGVHHYQILNDDEKIVVRLKLVQHYSAETQLSRKIIGLHLEASSLLGYEKEFKQVVQSIKLGEFNPSELPNVSQMLVAQGVKIKPIKNKLFGLTSTMRAEMAVSKMGLQLVEEALEHQPGLLDDIDTEFLHQYRVGFRKARSLVSLLKKSLSPEKQAHLKELLVSVFAPTNQLRDLDVFLLDKDFYQGLLPANYKSDINSLFKRIQTKREQAFKRLKKKLQSQAYRKNIDTLIVLLEAEPEFIGDNASMPVLKLAQRKIASRYKKVCTIGASIHPATPDAEVHELRIECKKIRYLLEFFAELFPKDTVTKLTKQLKALQNVLGRFNDYSVQQEFLQQLADREKAQGILGAINALVGVLHQKQLEARSQVEDAFVQFSHPATVRSIRSLTNKKFKGR